MPNGYYQSCNGCHVYATCSNGDIYDNRPCAADLVWDDNKKECDYTSNTCPGIDPTARPPDTTTTKATPTTTVAPPPTSGPCISSCKGMPNGDYQSCNGCHVYATCSNGDIYDNRPCAADLVWDDNKKECDYTSNTCPGIDPTARPPDTTTTKATPTTTAAPPPTSGPCISSCKGMPNGDYQSCKGCRVYATCSNGDIYDNRPCAADLVWDDNKKRCDYTSDTCHGTDPTARPPDTTTTKATPTTTVAPPPTSGPCISSCKGMPNGDYQSCNGCHVYATCSNGDIYDNRPCAADLVWDDNKKECDYTSNTCPGIDPTARPPDTTTTKATPTTTVAPPPTSGPCISSCKGMPNGDYQSCNGCHVYATCSNGDIYDNRPCAADLVWDDNKKECDYTSNTCPGIDPTARPPDTTTTKATPTTTAAPPPTSGPCISSCKGMPNGDYQSCKGCRVYATCSNGDIYDNRPCAADLVWDDNKKRCDYTSDTCHGTDPTARPPDTTTTKATPTTTVAPPPTSGPCISSCKGMPNGDYQSCNGCHVYATCSNGDIYDNRPCAADLVWDDNKKECDYTSNTCPGIDPTARPPDTTTTKATPTTTVAPPPTSGPCISSCKGMPNGDYQSCNGCHVYATCSNGDIYDNRPCAADLVWDDNKKECDYTSNTCPGIDPTARPPDTTTTKATPTTTAAPPPTSGPCISSCKGMPNGDYQSCKGCRVYATCSNGDIYDNRPCAADLVWDDNKKRCDYTSDTCHGTDPTARPPDTTTTKATPTTTVAPPPTSGPCISSCKGMPNGDYQSCKGCRVYATCSNGDIYDNRPCPANLVWDDNKKRCEWTSDTCHGTDPTTHPPDITTTKATPTTTAAPPPTSGPCISSCKGMPNGDYQSCKGCRVYATCSNGDIYDNRPCPANLVWDDNKKRCEWTSDTCHGTDPTTHPPDITTTKATPTTTAAPPPTSGPCISSCKGMPNGDYQSCKGCRVYATCSNGDIYDNRPCPANLVWDDNKKRCEWTSDTCHGTDPTTHPPDITTTKATPTTTAAPPPTSGPCISSCKGMPNGDYQSCKGCHVYATCSNGDIYDNRPCPANLVWDDNKKRCEWTSDTCHGTDPTTHPPDTTTTKATPTTTAAPPPTSDPGICICSCRGRPDGDFQSCKGCHVYATCSNGDIYDNRPCPADLVWDDNKKLCDWTSDTCPGGGTTTHPPDTTTTKATPTTTAAPPPTSGPCISSCKGMPNGDYQSCIGCHVYVTCSNGLTYDNRSCPADLVWDDNKKLCDWTSDTCPGGSTTAHPPETTTTTKATPTTTAAPPPTSGPCISFCKGMPDGDYQSCIGCHVYVTCSNGLTYDNRKCPADLVWDDNKKLCDWTSDTCPGGSTTAHPPETTTTTKATPTTTAAPPPTSGPCISSCKGMPNGDYQSCIGCHVYVTCSNGLTYDNRKCPADLVWDDNKKLCDWTSDTCPGGSTTAHPPETTTTTKATPTTTAAPPPTSGPCISFCKGMPDGDYQSCIGCHVYVTCSNGLTYDNRKCPADLVWDDNKKLCDWTSDTCPGGSTTAHPPETTTTTKATPTTTAAPPPTSGPCISFCKGMPDGDYQSCIGCHVYVTCSNGLTYDNRKCPADLVWDDNKKLCDWTSDTCPGGSTTSPPTKPPTCPTCPTCPSVEKKSEVTTSAPP